MSFEYLFLENLELYLVSMNTSVEFAEKLLKIREDCSLDFDGSKLHKYIHIIVRLNCCWRSRSEDDIPFSLKYKDINELWLFKRLAAEQFEEFPAAVMRIQEDGDPQTSSPHMVAVKVGR